jgi:hypothetical protein
MGEKEQPVPILANDGCRREHHDVQAGQCYEAPSDIGLSRVNDKGTVRSPLVDYLQKSDMGPRLGRDKI